ncbi:MAG: MATE family efflux transporter [Eubacteriales bacterium]|nr:MATE family efflux transporter [Eubacteriales bacterium]
MDLLRDDVRKTYRRYLAAAFGSSFISTIYSFVDMIVVGQYQGPSGTAALALISPVWNIIFSLGMLFGIGGSVHFGMLRGEKDNVPGTENRYFTSALYVTGTLSALIMTVLLCFDGAIFRALGAEGELLTLALDYFRPVRFAVPCYMLGQVVAAFLRNDNDPGLATAAVLIGGLFNVFGDCYFTFVLDMGLFGAGLATAIGSALTLAIMLTHFFKRENTLRLVPIRQLSGTVGRMIETGFSAFFADLAMGIVTALLNRGIVRYAGTDALAVYGVIVYVGTCAQCSAYSVGQAAQPLFSINFGARKWDRIRQTQTCAIRSVIVFSLFWTGVSMVFPEQIVRIFMDATPGVLEIAPTIIRIYATSFLLLPFNIYSAYYFQSIMRARAALWLAVARGLVISGGLILLLPLIFKATGLWIAMPITDAITFAATLFLTIRYTKTLEEGLL